MQFIDIKAQQDRIRPQIDARIKAVLDHGQYIMGPEVAELEEKLCAYTGAKHCITAASGTEALLISLMALGIGPGDEVITTPFTFVATAEVIALLGAIPVFVDIEPDTCNIDASKIEAAITDKTRAIIPVSLFGLPADMDAIHEAVESRTLKVDSNSSSTLNLQPSTASKPSTLNPQRIHIIEDAAQSFGATYKGRKSCNLSTLACTSFFPAKPLGCYGDGGAIFTDDDDVADVLRSIRIHGKGSDKYDNIRIGINGRLDTLQAAILLPKLEIFPEELVARQRAADTYTRLLSELTHNPSPIAHRQESKTHSLSPIANSREVNTHRPISTPFVPPGYSSAWAQYSILVESQEQRDTLQKQLAQAGVPTAIYYPKPLHLQTAYSGLGYKAGDFPMAEDVAQRILSLPMGPYVKEKDQVRVVEAVSESMLDR